jgi:hypothetical protein
MFGSSRELRLKPRSVSKRFRSISADIATRANRHCGADGRIQHPCRDQCDDTWRRLEIDKAAGSALLVALAPDTTPIQRVPAIMDLDLLPDMGRMTG